MKESLFAEPAQGPFCEERSHCCETAANSLTGRPTVPAVQPGGLPPEDIPAADAGYEYLDDAYGEVAAAWYDSADIPKEEEETVLPPALSEDTMEPIVWYPTEEVLTGEDLTEENTQTAEEEKHEIEVPVSGANLQRENPAEDTPELPVYYWSRG